MSWGSTSIAILALRNLIFDGPQDKFCSHKPVLGEVNGSNLKFKTFEYRRVTDFTTAAYPVGVFKNGTQLTTGNITSDDTATGSFVINVSVVPSNRDVISASYYYQWFTDVELDNFLQNASTWLGFNSTYINIPDGLNAAALRFAAQEAYLGAAMKYSVRAAETFKLEDAPSEEIQKSIDAFRSMANDFMDKARDLRDDYYTRQGQAKAPLFGFALGRVTDPTPRR